MTLSEFYPEHYVQSTERQARQYLVGITEARGWHRRNINIENYYYSAAAHTALLDKLPDFETSN
jgi:ectoine hydrolase